MSMADNQKTDGELNYKQVLHKIKKMMVDGVLKSKAPFHLVNLANVGGDGSPEVRVVVNRRVDFKTRTVIFHTDYRSSKVEEMVKNDSISMLFYSKEDKIQVRLRGKATIHHKDDLTSERWEATGNNSRRCYLQEQGSSSTLNDDGEISYSEDHDYGYENFAVVEMKFNSLEYLFLKNTGHKRLHFNWNEKNKVEVSELAP